MDHPMDSDDKRLLLLEHLEPFRNWSYESLIEAVYRTQAEHDCLKHVETTYADGTECQIEINVFWDDRPRGDVRVCADITTSPQRPLIGLLPVFTPDATDSFIMGPDGRFVGE